MESMSFRSKRQKTRLELRNIKVTLEKARISSKSTYFTNKNDNYRVSIKN